jgi:hypothetical protein
MVSLSVAPGQASARVGDADVGYGYPNYQNAVACVQQLIDDSPAPAWATVDHLFGPQTYNAIIVFQQWANSMGWDTGGVDGVVGPRTGTALLHSFYDPSWDDYCWNYLPTTY